MEALGKRLKIVDERRGAVRGILGAYQRQIVIGSEVRNIDVLR
jgi:hypothetical protein